MDIQISIDPNHPQALLIARLLTSEYEEFLEWQHGAKDKPFAKASGDHN